MRRNFLRYAFLATALWISITAIGLSQPAAAELFFSEYIEGSSNNKALEIYNGTGMAIDLAAGGYSVQMFFNGNPAAGLTINLAGVVVPGDVFVLAQSSANPTILAQADQTSGAGWFNGDDAVTLRKAGVVIDSIGQAGFDPGSEWGAGLVSTADNTLRRKCGVVAGDTIATDLFDPSLQWDGFATDAFSGLGSHTTVCGGLAASGLANPNRVLPGDSTLLTVFVSPATNPPGPSTGITVTGDLTSIGGSATQAFFDNATNGDVTAGDNIFAFQTNVALATSPGNKILPISIADAQMRTGFTSIGLGVAEQLAINQIQGSGSTSTHANALVATSGIVTGKKSNGFFIQTKVTFEDADPNTSEGIFIFTSSAPPAAAAVGNEVKVVGTVVEFIPGADPNSPPLTEIGNSPTVSVVSTGNPLPAPIPLTAADTSPAGSIEQLEKYEGMRVSVDSLTVVSPTMGSVSEVNATSTSNGVFYGVITGISRPFREPGIETPDPFPAGSPCCIPVFDANPERLRVDSDGQIGGSALEVTTGATVTGLVGPLDYSFRTYTILPDPATPPAASGNVSATAVPIPAADELTVGSFNLERFFNDVNDPGIGEPVLTATAFSNRLNKASLAIRNVMRAPHVIGVQEVENLTTLQALASKLNADDPGLNYMAYLEEGNDIGGIDVGFLVDTDRVSVSSVTQVGKTATFIDPTDGSVDLLNDRPPLVLEAKVKDSPGAPFRITVIVNHLRSLNDVDDPVDGARVRAKRGFQAEFLANYIAGRNPSDRIISVGDYNAFQFNDGYVDSIGTIRGRPTPPDEVVFASDDLVNPNLRDLVELAPASEQYSFTFDGNAQVLDHILITPNLLERFRSIDYGRNGADFPESYRNDSARPERVSDHDMPVAYFGYPE